MDFKGINKCEFDISIIEHVRDNPILWDTRLDEYKQSELKPDVWQKIADNIGCNVLQAQRRFKDMRSNMRRYLVMLAKWRQLSAGVDGSRLRAPTMYKYANELSFLVEVTHVELTDDTASTAVSEVDCVLDADLDVSQSSTSFNTEHQSLPSSSSKRRRQDGPLSSAQVDVWPADTQCDPRCDRRGLELLVPVDTQCDPRCDRRGQGLVAPSECDEDWLFAVSVYAKLRDLPSSYEKEEMKCRVMSDLLKLKYGTQRPAQTAVDCWMGGGEGMTSSLCDTLSSKDIKTERI